MKKAICRQAGTTTTCEEKETRKTKKEGGRTASKDMAKMQLKEIDA